MPVASYVKRRISVTMALGSAGATLDGQNNAVTLDGMRVSAAITKQLGISQGALDLRIYGMTQSLMNKFSKVGAAPLQLNLGNTITVQAGDDTYGLTTVYSGTISSAWGDYEQMPQVAFHVTGLMALDGAVKAVPPTSYRGGADAATVMSNIAKVAGYAFENGGVSGILLSNPYFPGTAVQQAERCAHAAGINWTVDNGTLAIWPQGGSRGGAIPLVSKDTGLVGYPAATPLGPVFRTLFSPTIRAGGQIQLQSSVTPVNGKWQVSQLDHLLESETPGGAWFTTVTCVPVGFIAQ